LSTGVFVSLGIEIVIRSHASLHGGVYDTEEMHTEPVRYSYVFNGHSTCVRVYHCIKHGPLQAGLSQPFSCVWTQLPGGFDWSQGSVIETSVFGRVATGGCALVLFEIELGLGCCRYYNGCIYHNEIKKQGVVLYSSGAICARKQEL